MTKKAMMLMNTITVKRAVKMKNPTVREMKRVETSDKGWFIYVLTALKSTQI